MTDSQQLTEAICGYILESKSQQSGVKILVAVGSILLGNGTRCVRSKLLQIQPDSDGDVDRRVEGVMRKLKDHINIILNPTCRSAQELANALLEEYAESRPNDLRDLVSPRVEQFVIDTFKDELWLKAIDRELQGD